MLYVYNTIHVVHEFSARHCQCLLRHKKLYPTSMNHIFPQKMNHFLLIYYFTEVSPLLRILAVM